MPLLEQHFSASHRFLLLFFHCYLILGIFFFSLFFLKLYLIFLYNIVQVRHPVWGFGEVMTWVWEPVPANPLASVQGGCGHDMRREAAMAGLPLTHYSAMVLWLSGGLSFLNEHSLFWSSSFSSSQSVSSQAMSLPFLGLLSNPVFQHLVPVCTSLTPVSGWGMQGYGTDHLCRSHSILHATTISYAILQPLQVPFLFSWSLTY